MKRLITLISILLFQFTFSQQINDKSLLWEISENGLKENSYIYGTMHIMCAGDVKMTPEIDSAFNKTQVVLMELDMDDPSLMTKMMKATLTQDGKTVSEKLGPELSAKVDTLLRQNSTINLSMVNSVNLQTLSMQLGMFALDCQLDLGYDMLFMQEAKSVQKEIQGLESVEFQIETILSQSDDESKKAIEYIVNNFDEVKSEMNKLMTLYKSEDVQGLYNMTKETFEDPKYPQGNLEEFLDKRNINWIPIIEKSIKEKPVFIVVGAAHLAGEKGIINLLRKAGYTAKTL